MGRHSAGECALRRLDRQIDVVEFSCSLLAFVFGPMDVFGGKHARDRSNHFRRLNNRVDADPDFRGSCLNGRNRSSEIVKNQPQRNFAFASDLPEKKQPAERAAIGSRSEI